MTARISTKGQLVIPQEFRRALNLRAGDKVSFSLEGEKLLLQRDRTKSAQLKQGKFGRPVLVAPREAPAMTPQRVKVLLEDLP